MPVKTLQNFDQNIRNCIPTWFVFPSRCGGKIDVGAELRLHSIRDNPLPGRSENCQASWLCQKLLNSEKGDHRAPSYDWIEWGCPNCAVRIRKVAFARLSKLFLHFCWNQYFLIRIVIGALVGAREAWNILWVRVKSKLDGFGHFGIFCQNRKNPLKLGLGS